MAFLCTSAESGFNDIVNCTITKSSYDLCYSRKPTVGAEIKSFFVPQATKAIRPSLAQYYLNMSQARQLLSFPCFKM
jgi:hypothetical protein